MAEMWSVIPVLLCLFGVFTVEASVSYDSKAIIINGQRRILISGSIHYPRSTPEVMSISFSFSVLVSWFFGCLFRWAFIDS